MRLARSFIPAFLIASGSIAACTNDGSSTAPSPVAFDAPHALARIEPIAVIFDQPILSAFDAEEGFFETFFRSALAASVTGARRPPADALGFQLGVTRSLTALGQRLTASAIPVDEKGKTFVWNADTRTFVADPAVAGAPADGVRFILYAWGLNAPSLPLTRLGYVDIAPPEGADASAEQAEILIERDVPRTFVGDFVVTHHTYADVNSFSIDGSATDARTVALIALDGTETGAAGQHHLVFNSDLSSSPAGVSAVEQLTSDQATASQSGRLELDYEGHRFTAESVATGSELKFDGSLYARVIFPLTTNDQTQYLRPDGTRLSDQEVADVNALLNRAVVANFFWINLAWP
jgi:hypothetical protein